MAKFQGSTAISSADYFERKGSGSGGGGGSGGAGLDADMTAADLVNRLSFQAKQDLQQVKQVGGPCACRRPIAGSGEGKGVQ